MRSLQPGTDLHLCLSAHRGGLSFRDVLAAAAADPELVAGFDRLQGANLGLRGSPIDLAIDRASGRLDAEMRAFVDFVWDAIFLRF